MLQDALTVGITLREPGGSGWVSFAPLSPPPPTVHPLMPLFNGSCRVGVNLAQGRAPNVAKHSR